MKVGGLGWVGVTVAGGRSTLIARVATGIATMNTIRSTSMTSTKGVTLMSEFCPKSYRDFLPPLTFAAIKARPCLGPREPAEKCRSRATYPGKVADVKRQIDRPAGVGPEAVGTEAVVFAQGGNRMAG